MKNANNCFTIFFLTLIFPIFMMGCAGGLKYTRSVPPEKIVIGPEAGMAMVVFMRPTSFGMAIQSSVYKVDGDNLELVGFAPPRRKISYQLEPGKYLFMVWGESADFMSAELEGDKTYYALVTPRVGVWKARFSLRPIHADEIGSEKFIKWRDSCEWVENSPSSYEWANDHMSTLKEKRKFYYERWMKKDPSARPKLLPEDGI